LEAQLTSCFLCGIYLWLHIFFCFCKVDEALPAEKGKNSIIRLLDRQAKKTSKIYYMPSVDNACGLALLTRAPSLTFFMKPALPLDFAQDLGVCVDGV
jgi:hypothetical protein